MKIGNKFITLLVITGTVSSFLAIFISFEPIKHLIFFILGFASYSFITRPIKVIGSEIKSV